MIIDICPIHKNILGLYYMVVYYKRKKNGAFKFEYEIKDFKTIEEAEDYRYHTQKRMWNQQRRQKVRE